MECAFCGYGLALGVTKCSRCGGVVANAAPPYANAAPPFAHGRRPAAPGSDLFAPPPPYGSDLFDGPTTADPVPLPGGRPANDPESDLRTSIVSQDRQADISTKIVEAPPVKPTDPIQQKGLPDSRVARGVEDSLLEIKRMFFRMGRIGRLALWSHVIVIIGSAAPWHYLPYEGFTPGLEAWGWLTMLLSIGGIATLSWRHKQNPGMRVLPVLLHLLIGASLILVLLWRYQEYQLIGEHLRPSLSVGFYICALGALGATFGALLGLKDVR